MQKLEEEMQADSNRCKECNPLRMQIMRLKAESATNKEFFEDMAPTDRLKFYQVNKGKLAAELKTVIKVHISQVSYQSRVMSLAGTGTFLDEHDLREKYKTKPGVQISK